MLFIKENLGTIIVGFIVLAIVITIIVNMVKNKKNRKSSCGGGCSGCGMNNECHSTDSKDKN